MFIFSQHLLSLVLGFNSRLGQNSRLLGFFIIHFLKISYIPKLYPAEWQNIMRIKFKKFKLICRKPSTPSNYDSRMGIGKSLILQPIYYQQICKFEFVNRSITAQYTFMKYLLSWLILAIISPEELTSIFSIGSSCSWWPTTPRNLKLNNFMNKVKKNLALIIVFQF